MRKRRSKLLILLLLVTGVWIGHRFFKDDIIGFVKDIFASPTPRSAFMKKAKSQGIINEALLTEWDSIYQVAKSDILQVNVPHREVISLNSKTPYSAQAWRFKLPAGRRLSIKVTNAKGLLFGDLYELPETDLEEISQKRPIISLDTLNNQLDIESGDAHAANLLLLIQAKPQTALIYDLQITTTPVLHFPVEGKNAKAIGSFWGDPRDGGRRKHEGNDIFATRGTPLLAVADGRITSTRTSNLGGKTVWLEDGEGRPIRYYYAHLDKRLVQEGDYVTRGEPVGLVGNTGNAINTPPHLHFGIYQEGAIDPFNFLNDADQLPAYPKTKIKNRVKKIPSRGKFFLRTTPDKNGKILSLLKAKEEIILLGSTARFYRVKTARGELGYVNFD